MADALMSGTRLLPVVLVWLSAAGASRGGETVVRLNVALKAAPRPALRYLLLPELRDLSPGNPVPVYLRCVLEIESSPEGEASGSAALREVDRAARLDHPDWEILQKLKSDGIGLLIPDVQKMRLLGQGLHDRLQGEVDRHRTDDALRTVQTMFALARHVGENPIFISHLVGIAVAGQAIGPLEDLLQQPDCPNLYWALTNLPAPLMPLDRACEGERTWLLAEFGHLVDPAPLDRRRLDETVEHLDKLHRLASDRPVEGLREWLDRRTKDGKLVASARGRLVAAGLAREAVGRYPPEQVLLLDQKRLFEVRHDEGMKLMRLPAWQVEAMAADLKEPAEGPSLFNGLLPAFLKFRRIPGRLEQRLALLRHVEALRLYAAGHDGKLPRKLSDDAVPLPPDPFTGRPFVYRVEGATAYLQGTPPRGEEQNAPYNVRYEVTLRK